MILINFFSVEKNYSELFLMGIEADFLDICDEIDIKILNFLTELLTCLSKLIKFIPALYYKNLNKKALFILYRFATLPLLDIEKLSKFDQVGLISMECIYELMLRSFSLGNDYNEFIFNVFNSAFRFQHALSTKFSNNTVAVLREDNLKKFIDFFRLFITGHLKRFENSDLFPIDNFLASLLSFTTVSINTPSCYLMLLETWSLYFDYITNCINVKHENQLSIHDLLLKIKEPVFNLLMFVMKSMQYSSNRDFLQKLQESSVENNVAEDDDDNDETVRLDKYLQTSIEIIAKIAEIYPNDVISIVDENLFNLHLTKMHACLEYTKKSFDQQTNICSNGKLLPAQMINHPLGMLQIFIYDFITTLKIYSRFSNFFVDERFERYFVRTRTVFEKLFDLLHFIDANQLCHLTFNPLLNEIIDLKAQIIATFKAYIVWIQQWLASPKFLNDNSQINGNIIDKCDNNILVNGHYSENIQKNCNSRVHHFLKLIIDSCCTIICDNSILVNVQPEVLFCSKKQLYHSAALTLNAITANIRLLFIYRLQSVQHLLDQNVQASVLQLTEHNNTNNGHNYSVPLTDQILISQTISNLLILPWVSVPVDMQDWDQRSICLNGFINNFLQIFNNMNLEILNKTDNHQSQQRKPDNKSKKCPNVYCRSLYILKKVIKSHGDSPLKCKQLIYGTLNSSFEAFIQLLMQNSLLHTTDGGCQITEHILALFHVLFNVLLGQIHIDTVKRTIQTLLQIINAHNILPLANNGGEQACHPTEKSLPALNVLTQFHKLLIMIVKQTAINSTLRSLLPDIMEFTLVHVQNNLISPNSSLNAFFRSTSGKHYDLYEKFTTVYYRFLYELLLNNQRYFFPQSNVMNKLPFTNALTNNNKATSIDLNQEKFFLIIEIFSQSFMQTENLNLFCQNMKALESLNSSINLYRKPLFKNTFMAQFLFLFMQTLYERTLTLLNDGLYTIIYHLAEADYQAFYQVFIPKYLTNIPQLNDQQRLQLATNIKVDPPTNNRELLIDHHTFSTKLNQFLCDIHFYTQNN